MVAKTLSRRLLQSAATILVALFFTFLLIRSMPGDIVHTWALEIMSSRGISYEQAYQLAKLNLNYDPDVPLLTQWVSYLGGLAHGNLGTSLTYRLPVARLILQALPWTLFICTTSLILSFILGTGIGTWIGLLRGSTTEQAVVTVSVLLQSVPDFMIALILLVIFAVNLGLFPLRGSYSVDVTPGLNGLFLLSALHHGALPIAAYTIALLGGWILSMRSSVTGLLSEDYITLARARGLRRWRIIVHYLGRNAVLPQVSALAISFGAMLGGAMFIESIFSFPGLGYFLGQAIGTRDYPLMQGLLLLTTVGIVCANLAADFIYSLLDPRIRFK